MRVANIIKRLDEMYDQVKYHGGSIPDVPEFLLGLSDELRSINADEIVEANAKGAENGFNHARNSIIREVLKNSELKTRGDMIKATEKLTGHEGISETKLKEVEERTVPGV